MHTSWCMFSHGCTSNHVWSCIMYTVCVCLHILNVFVTLVHVKCELIHMHLEAQTCLHPYVSVYLSMYMLAHIASEFSICNHVVWSIWYFWIFCSEYMTYIMEALELEDTVKNYDRRNSTGWLVHFVFLDMAVITFFFHAIHKTFLLISFVE